MGFLCGMKESDTYKEERLEVRSYFREGGRVVGTERCDSEREAKTFALHQLSLFSYVEIVRVLVEVTFWGENELRVDLVKVYR